MDDTPLPPLIPSDANFAAGTFNGSVIDTSMLTIFGNLVVNGSTTLGPVNIFSTTQASISVSTLFVNDAFVNITVATYGALYNATIGTALISYLTNNTINALSSGITNLQVTSSLFGNILVTSQLNSTNTILSGTNIISGPLVINGVGNTLINYIPITTDFFENVTVYPLPNNVFGYLYTGEYFVLSDLFYVSSEYLSLISTNGITWQTQQLANEDELRSVGYSEILGTYVATIFNDDLEITYMAQSNNALSWTTTVILGLSDINIVQIVWSNELSLFCGVVGGFGSGVISIIYSDSGMSWTTLLLDPIILLLSIAWSSKLEIFCAVGSYVAISNDGITWVTNDTVNDLGLILLESVCWSQELRIFCASGYNSLYSEILTSPDGISWTIQFTTNITSYIQTVIWAPELSYFLTACGVLLYSPNGISWTTFYTLLDDFVSLVWNPFLFQFAAISNNELILVSTPPPLSSMNTISSQDLFMQGSVLDIFAHNLVLDADLVELNSEYLTLNAGIIGLGSITVSTLVGSAANAPVFLFDNLNTGTMYMQTQNISFGPVDNLGTNVFIGTTKLNTLSTNQISSSYTTSIISLYSNLTAGTLTIGAKNIVLSDSLGRNTFPGTNIFQNLTVTSITSLANNSFVTLYPTLSTGTLAFAASNISIGTLAGTNVFVGTNQFVRLITGDISGTSTGVPILGFSNNANVNIYSNLSAGTLTIGSGDINFGTSNGINIFNGTSIFPKVIVNTIKATSSDSLVNLFSGISTGTLFISSKNITVSANNSNIFSGTNIFSTLTSDTFEGTSTDALVVVTSITIDILASDVYVGISNTITKFLTTSLYANAPVYCSIFFGTSVNSNVLLYQNLTAGTLSVGGKNISIGTVNGTNVFVGTNIFQQLTTNVIATTATSSNVTLYSNLTTGTVTFGAKNINMGTSNSLITFNTAVYIQPLITNTLNGSSALVLASMYTNLTAGTVIVNPKNITVGTLNGNTIFIGSTYIQNPQGLLITNIITATATNASANIYSNLPTGTLTIGSRNLFVGTNTGINTFLGTVVLNNSTYTDLIVATATSSNANMYSNISTNTLTIGPKNLNLGQNISNNVIAGTNFFSRIITDIIVATATSSNASLFPNLNTAGSLTIGSVNVNVGTIGTTSISFPQTTGAGRIYQLNTNYIFTSANNLNTSIYENLSTGTLVIGAKNIAFGTVAGRNVFLVTNIFPQFSGNIIYATATNASASIYSNLSTGTLTIGAKDIHFGTISGQNIYYGSNIIPTIYTDIITATATNSSASLYSNLSAGTLTIGATNIIIGVSNGLNIFYGTNIFTTVIADLIVSTATNSLVSIYSNLTVNTLTIGAKNITFGTSNSLNIFSGTNLFPAINTSFILATSYNTSARVYANLSTGTINVGSSNTVLISKAGQNVMQKGLWINNISYSTSYNYYDDYDYNSQFYTNLSNGILYIGTMSTTFATGSLININAPTVSIGYHENISVISGSIISTISRTSPAVYNWFSITNNRQKFCAVGSTIATNNIITSDDGITWDLRSKSPNNLALNGVVWSEELGIFSAVGYNIAFTSPDAITWTSQTVHNFNWLSITWSPQLSLFAAAAHASGLASQRIMTSYNGINWTTRTCPHSDLIYPHIIWSDFLNLFILIHYSEFVDTTQAIITSPDGIVWTFQTHPSLRQFHGLCSANEIGLVIITTLQNSTSCILTSPDAITWTIRTTDVANQLFVVSWSPELGIAAALTNTIRGYQSYDGILWTSFVISSTNQYNAICWNPYLSMFAGVANNAILTTTNTYTSAVNVHSLVYPWVTQTPPSLITWVDVCWSSELSLFCATAQASSANNIMTSVDGITWTLRSKSNANGLNRLDWSPSLRTFVAVGNSNTIFTSPTGIDSWVSRTSPTGTRNWNDVVWCSDLNIFCACDNASGGTANKIMTSSDSITWITSATPLFSYASIAWGASIGLFAAASTIACATAIITSPDAITWTTRTTPTGLIYSNLCFSNELNMFVMTSQTLSTNSIVTTTDGITWISRSTGTNATLYSVQWSPQLSTFVALSGNGLVMVSQDGATWSYSVLPIGTFYGTTWSPELMKFVSVSNNGVYIATTTSTVLSNLHLGSVLADVDIIGNNISIGATANIIEIGRYASEVNIYNQPFYYNSNTLAASISVVSTYVSDITIYGVPQGTYIFNLTWNNITKQNYMYYRIISASGSVLYQSAEIDLQRGVGAVAVGPKEFMGLIILGSKTDVTYQITGLTTGSVFSAGTPRFLRLFRT